MEKKDQEIIDKLKQQTKNTKIPSDINPDQLKSQLKEEKVSWFTPKKIVALASILILALGLGVIYQTRNTYHKLSQTNKSQEKEELALANSYEEIYQALKEPKASLKERFSIDRYPIAGDVSSSSQEANEGATSYTDTNVRQEGVGEGDVVKSDGTYLYVLKANRDSVVIVDTRDNELKEVSHISPENFSHIVEIYVVDDKLVLVGSNSAMTAKPLDLAREMPTEEGYEANQELTLVLTYDISQKEEPKLIGEMSQSGFYQSSRVAKGYLYLFSDYSLREKGKKGQPETYIPMTNQNLLEAKDILLPLEEGANRYTVISALSLENPGQSTSSKAILSQYGNYYVSNEHIYFYEENWEEEGTKTIVRKLSYQDGKLKALAKGEFWGYLNDSYSIDEYKGNLRVVVTDGEYNNLYIFDKDLKLLGDITELALDERIYSARFMGETGYFVTFKEVDPLFSVDLSNPRKPQIIGELKIPGFSQYLHPYKEGLLLGIGMEVDKETGVTEGIKLSMFDISNPANVTEVHKEILSTDYYSELFYNYKGFLFDQKTGVFGFSSEGEGGLCYNLFTYQEEGFIKLMKPEVNASVNMETRGIIIKENLYVINGNIIEAYDLKDYEKINSLII